MSDARSAGRKLTAESAEWWNVREREARTPQHSARPLTLTRSIVVVVKKRMRSASVGMQRSDVDSVVLGSRNSDDILPSFFLHCLLHCICVGRYGMSRPFLSIDVIYLFRMTVQGGCLSYYDKVFLETRFPLYLNR